MAKLPFGVKQERIEGPFLDENGHAYARIIISFRWWFWPVAMFNYWRSLRFGRSSGAPPPEE